MKPLVSVDELRRLMPRLSLMKAVEYAPMLSASMIEFSIVSKKRRCAYLSQLAVESEQLNHWTENLNYSAHRLTQVWPKRFPSIAAAAPYAMNAEALANKVYGGRMGNTKQGDGWKYRGRFPIQATGGEMYRKLANALGVYALRADPDLCLEDKLIGFRASAWIFAVEKACNQLADKLKMDGGAHDRGVLTEICERVNGGHTGLSERLNYFRIAKQVLRNDDEGTPSPIAPPTARPAESVHEEEENESNESAAQAGTSAIVAQEHTGTDLLGAAVHSDKAKRVGLSLGARVMKHSSAGLTFLYAFYEANKIGFILVVLVLIAGVLWLLYHNRKKFAPHVLKWLK
jgi:putative chitinase